MSQNPILKAGSASDVINRNKGRVEYGNILGQQMAVEAGILPSVTLQKGGGGSASSRVASILGSSVVTAAERTTAVTNLISNVSINATTAIRLSAAARGSYGITNVPGAVTITIPGAPTGLVATPSSQTLSIAFSINNGGSAITNYSYSMDGTTYRSFSPAQTSSPVTITTLTDGTTALTNGTPYTVYLKAINAIGTGPASAALTATPATVPGAPTIGTPTAGNGSVSLTFTAPGSNGGSAITNYSYSTDGTNYIALSPARTTSPLSITGLTNGVAYTIRIRAINAAGSSAASSASSSFTPTAPPSFTVTSGTASTSIANGRTYYRFTTNGSITVAGAAATVEIFAVGGGGAGGRGNGDPGNYGGGGGGGGLQTNSSTYATGTQLVTIPALTAGAVYTIVVGDGGIRAENDYAGGAGSNTTFSGTGITTVTAFGGGVGKGRWVDYNAPAGVRGCGGGGRGPGENNGLGTQGFNGNFSVLNGGGGGIGATTTNLIGGAGLTYPSGGITYGIGGTGSSDQSQGADGTANTGNGGGGGGQSNGVKAGNGGSGVFIISHPNS